MKQCIKVLPFLQQLFDREELALKATPIVEAILAARSPRLSDISQHMPGLPAANYKAIQRFLYQVDLQVVLQRLFQDDAPFVLADPTEIPRPQARRTSYVGKLKDGKTRGFWLLLLATPFRGRAIPCGLVTYSSKTIAQTATSRNQFHWEAFDQIKAFLGDRPLVLDREFSYLDLLQYLTHASIHFVIRLNLGSKPPTFTDAEGRRVDLSVGLGQQVTYHQLRYKDSVMVNVVGIWEYGHAKPLWIMSDLPPEQAYAIYASRMKVEETFRDLKSLLGLDKLMNKSQQHMEQMAALVLIAYTIGLLTGEIIRDQLYGPPLSLPTLLEDPTSSPVPSPPRSTTSTKWARYSGLFILLKQKIPLPYKTLRKLLSRTLLIFTHIVLQPVRTHV